MAGLMNDIRVVILDIEGTTTPISFVKDKLFPYIRVNIRTYLEKNFETGETQDDINALRKQAEEDRASGLEVAVPAAVEQNREKVVESFVLNVLQQMALDRKTTALKQLQGHMWRDAFASGEVVGEVYDDVPAALKRWTGMGLKVYIYSSGSVNAQKLLFGHSVHGDMLSFFSGHFDTTIGSKVEKESYTRIANALAEMPERILFLTDIVKEAEAARAAGLRTGLVIREGNAPLSEGACNIFPTIDSFAELFQD